MHIATRLSVRAVISVLVVFAIAVMSACAVDPTNGIAGSGAVGSLGSECRCPDGSPECNSVQGQCLSGMTCSKLDSGDQICTHECPCPLNFICRALGVPGQRSGCVKQQP